MNRTFPFFPLFAIAILAISIGHSQAGGENDVVRLAHNLERVGRDVKGVFQTHFKKSSAYRHLIREIDDILSKADHINQLARDPKSTSKHIKADLADLNKLTDHLYDVVEDVERGRYSGNVDDGLGLARKKMRALNDAINSLQRAISTYSGPGDESSSGIKGWIGTLLGG